MNINVQIEIPDEFFNSITPDDIVKFLKQNGFTEFDKPQLGINALSKDGYYLYVYNEGVCSLLIRYSERFGIDFLELIQAFGWGKCQTCKKFACEFFNGARDILNGDDNFGCIHYQFRSAT